MSDYYDEFTRWLLSGTRKDDASSEQEPVREEVQRHEALRQEALRKEASKEASRQTQVRYAAPEAGVRQEYEPEPERDEELPPRKSRLSITGSAPKHPGEILSRHLQSLELTASDLARDIDVPVNRITGILNGQRGITADTALRLGHWFGVEATDWLELQLQYELSQAQRAAGQKIRHLPTLAHRESV